MSQLYCRIAKLSSSSVVKQKRLCFSELRSFSTAATPYLLFNETWHKERTPSGEKVVDLNLYDPRKDERVKISDRILSEELRASKKIGSSRGWVCLQNIHDSTVRLTNMYNPCASVASHTVISLPPLDHPKARVISISLSASPNQQDCVVVAKSTHPFLSLCRLGDSEWTHIQVPFFPSGITYSVRNRRFYLNTEHMEDYEGPFDLITTTSSNLPQLSLYQSFPNPDIPKSRHDHVISTIKNQYLVESPSGDSLIVYWCKEYLNRKEMEAAFNSEPPLKLSCMRKTKAFVVFRQDPEERIGSYTEDIGDLCIFLSNSEAFCVSAAEYPGLKPNCVYFANYDTGFGYYDLSSNTLHEVVDPPPLSHSYLWLAPLQ